MSLLILVKDICVLTIFVIKKFLEYQEKPQMRPQASKRSLSRIGRDTSMNISNYLLNLNDDFIDDEGNTSMHQLTKIEDIHDLDTLIELHPHLLFMLNNNGHTPLDIAISENDDEKTLLLINKIKKLDKNCSLKFVMRPHRLELKYEKAFTLATVKNNLNVL